MRGSIRVRRQVVVIHHQLGKHRRPSISSSHGHQVAGPCLAVLTGPAVRLTPPPGRVSLAVWIPELA